MRAELLKQDQDVIDRVNQFPKDDPGLSDKKKAAEKEYKFPSALKERFPSLNLYDGDTVGVGEGNRATGAAEQWACVCSLAVMTTCLCAKYASEKGDGETVKKAQGMLVQYQKRGSKLFGVHHDARPLTEDEVVEWGSGLISHADTPEKMGASYLTMVIHDLTKVKSIVAPLAEKYPQLNDEALTAKFIDGVIAGEAVLPGSYRGPELTDIKTCDEAMRNAIKAGFLTGFNASQVMQGESTAVDGLKVSRFLKDHPDALWFMDHYLLDTAGILGKPHAFIGSIIVDGNTFKPYNAYINCLVSGTPQGGRPAGDMSTSCQQANSAYHEYRLGADMVNAAKDDELGQGLQTLAKDLGVKEAEMRVAFARTVELSRATTNEAARGLLKCWQHAKERFGPELIAGLVTEMNIDGVDRGSHESSNPLEVVVMLEYSPKTMNDAAKSDDWEAEVSIILGAWPNHRFLLSVEAGCGHLLTRGWVCAGLFAVLWRCGRAAIVAQSEAGETRNPYTVTINPIAMRTAPKYAESSGYTWLQWFGEMLQAWRAGNALAPLLEKAVCAKELQLEWAANI